MTADLLLPDVAAAADLGTLVGRARRVDPDGAIRLIARGGVLAAFVCVVGAPGPTVLGLRTLVLADPDQVGEVDVDVTVALSAVADRCARVTGAAQAGDTPVAFSIPPVQVSASWAGISPPRQGWEPDGSVPADLLLAAARTGATEIGRGSPEGSGAQAVARLRGLVWGRPLDPQWPALPAGMAFAAELLGLTRAGDPSLPVHRCGRWSRLTAARGYLLARPAATL